MQINIHAYIYIYKHTSMYQQIETTSHEEWWESDYQPSNMLEIYQSILGLQPSAMVHQGLREYESTQTIIANNSSLIVPAQFPQV